jgi:hypothetical protein
MRLIGTERDCGPLLELSQLQRRLRLGSPVSEGQGTIEVANIIGTASRGGDFDACFRPLRRHLQRRLRAIMDAEPNTLDEPIEVIRVDRAYFVVDGHKRVAIAHQTGREFIDALVSRLSSPYALDTEVAEEEIERTAREGEFRRHSGLASASPDARFALNSVGDYGELFDAFQSYAFGLARDLGRLPAPEEVASRWYAEVFQPMVAAGRHTVGRLIDDCSDADVFLSMHRLSRSAWGTECDAAECAEDMLLAARRRSALERTGVGRILSVSRRSQQPRLLPLADSAPALDDG